ELVDDLLVGCRPRPGEGGDGADDYGVGDVGRVGTVGLWVGERRRLLVGVRPRRNGRPAVAELLEHVPAGIDAVARRAGGGIDLVPRLIHVHVERAAGVVLLDEGDRAGSRRRVRAVDQV